MYLLYIFVVFLLMTKCGHCILFFVINHRMELLGHRIFMYLVSIDSYNEFSKVAGPIYSSARREDGPYLFHTFTGT